MVGNVDLLQLLPSWESDAYAQFFYDSLNPLTHLDAYAHGPAISFICGERDTAVPPSGALRFQPPLREKYPAAGDHVQVSFIPGMALCYTVSLLVILANNESYGA